MSEPQHPAQAVAEQVKRRLPVLAKEMAAKMGGRPMDAESVSREEAARLWHVRNPQADPMQAAALVQAGRHAEAMDYLYPWRSKLIGPGSPTVRAERAEALAQQAAQMAAEPMEVPDNG